MSVCTKDISLLSNKIAVFFVIVVVVVVVVVVVSRD